MITRRGLIAGLLAAPVIIQADRLMKVTSLKQEVDWSQIHQIHDSIFIPPGTYAFDIESLEVVNGVWRTMGLVAGPQGKLIKLSLRVA